MGESEKQPPTGTENTQPMAPIPEMPKDLPEAPGVPNAPDTIQYRPDGTMIDTLLTTPEGLDDAVANNQPVTDKDIQRVAAMNAARKK